jgi:hypothetical protein
MPAMSRRLRPGAIAHVPGGVTHWFHFITDGEMLSVTSGPGASRLFTAIDAANPSGPPDMDAVMSAIVSNGGTLVAAELIWDKPSLRDPGSAMSALGRKRTFEFSHAERVGGPAVDAPPEDRRLRGIFIESSDALR